MHKGDLGRWYYNYAAALHPALAYVVPPGDWGPVENPPRWVQEVYDAPWMGEFDLPQLSSPRYHEGKLVSPALVKLHVFSTVTAKSREKRFLIRRLSPLNSIPKAYRHLFELKFVLGHAYKPNWDVDEEMESLLAQEQEEYGDLVRLNLVHGENLREGKILDWMRAAGTGDDGGRAAWWLFKVDDDNTLLRLTRARPQTVMNLPVFLDTLTTLDPQKPIYLGTSLNRWPAFHYHFTGMLTGFSWPLLQTLAAGIGKMSRQEIEAWWDDDVLTGELMFCLPPAPHCRPQSLANHILHPLPAYCDPRLPPPWGYTAPPPNPDPRTDLIRYDLLRRMGDKAVWFVKGDVARHSWWFKFNEEYEKEWEARIKGSMWSPPDWLERFAEGRDD
ncbi:hypothetical protein EHS25_009785 [Saitozyma podzolica]|uniref:Uncharacterized protein n=1 Tax=Saitozyma podzolica TaxID=1890683 RepID=A0A427YK92_9TREE|nr:hypothetical protein EHS25_009785 [Saitozyma podzolica]